MLIPERGRGDLPGWGLALLGLGVLAGVALVLIARRAPQVRPGLDALRASIAGDENGVEIHDLGDGFYELVGEVGSRARAQRIEGAIAGVEGVAGVVNRLWII